jgi:hypothetical protein
MFALYAPPSHQENYGPATEAVSVGEQQAAVGWLCNVPRFLTHSEFVNTAQNFKALAVFDYFRGCCAMARVPLAVVLPVQKSFTHQS